MKEVRDNKDTRENSQSDKRQWPKTIINVAKDNFKYYQRYL